MRTINIVTLLLVIVGGVNWLLVGIADFDLVAALFGTDTTLTNLVYIIVGISALATHSALARFLRRRDLRGSKPTSLGNLRYREVEPFLC